MTLKPRKRKSYAAKKRNHKNRLLKVAARRRRVRQSSRSRKSGK